MSVGYRTLIFEPDAAVGKALAKALSSLDCSFVWCDQGAHAKALIDAAKIDVAVISLASNGSGLEIIDHLSKTASTVPFLLVTSADALETRVLGLNRGAADYLIRPVSAEELLARVATVAHRREYSQERFIRRGQITLDRETGQFGDSSRWTVLSPTERKILSLLFGSGDRLVSKQRLKSALADGGSVSDNAIEVSIHRLRTKARSWGLRIRSYRRLGYILEDVGALPVDPIQDSGTLGSGRAIPTDFGQRLVAA